MSRPQEIENPTTITARVEAETRDGLDEARGPGESRSDVIRQGLQAHLTGATEECPHKEKLGRARRENQQLREKIERLEEQKAQLEHELEQARQANMAVEIPTLT